MQKAVRAISRRLVLVLALALVPAALGFGVALLMPRSYQSTATLWAFTRYQLVGTTATDVNVDATPASSQAAALSELLQSRAFDVLVAQGTDLAKAMGITGYDPQEQGDLLTAELSKSVVVAAVGYNLYTVSYTGSGPQVAEEVVKSVVDQYALQSVSLSAVQAKQLLTVYKQELTDAQTKAHDAAQAEQDYLSSHPSLQGPTLATDPEYNLLHAESQQAQATLSNIQDNIYTLSQQLSSMGQSSTSLFQVLDQPEVPLKGTSRTKLLLLGGVAGLLIGLLACALYVVLLVRADRAVYGKEDLIRITSVPLLLDVPDYATIAVGQNRGR